MTCFLPSEVARLVLGYLKEEQCTKSYKIFLKECPFLNEYRLMLERGQECPTRIVGKGLKDMLEEYGQLKIQESSSNSQSVWTKFDTVVHQLKNVANRSQLSSGTRPQSLATFQRMRGRYNTQKHTLGTRVAVDNVSLQSSSGGSAEGLGIPQESLLLSEPASSPSSSRDKDHEDEDESTQLLMPQSNASLQNEASGRIQNEAPGTSTPGNKSRFRHPNLPINSPIVVSDSDHPFSPESNPSTPLRGGSKGARFKDLQDSPKSHLTALSNPRQSPLFKGKKKTKDSPRHFSQKENIFTQPEGNVYMCKVNNVKRVELTQQEMAVHAMRTGQVSGLLVERSKNSIANSKPQSVSKDSGKKQNPSAGQKTVGQDFKDFSEDVEMGQNLPTEEVDPDPRYMNCVSPGDATTSEATPSVDTDHFTPVKKSCQSATGSAPLTFHTPMKTPIKNFLDECSRDAFRSPKRKSQAPKRRSLDPATAKEAPLVTPVKTKPPILSMPLFEELVNSSKFAEKLASSINQARCPDTPDKEASVEAKPDQSQSSQETPVDNNNDLDEKINEPAPKETAVTPKKPNLRRKNSPSPKPRPKKRVSFEKSESADQDPVNSGSGGADGNESTGSIKPPLSVDELDSILEDTQMSESTIQGIINLTQNDPELDALFNLINMDKQEFIEKEYGISLSDFKFSTTPKKNSSAGDTESMTSNILRLCTEGSATNTLLSTEATSANTVLGSEGMSNNNLLQGAASDSSGLVHTNPVATSVYSLSTMSLSQADSSQNNLGAQGLNPSDGGPVSSTVISLPLIHVSAMSSNTPSITTSEVITEQSSAISVNSCPSGSTTSTCGGSFLQLLHSATDTRDSYIETVQVLASGQQQVGGSDLATQSTDDLQQGQGYTKVDAESPNKGLRDRTSVLSRKNDDTESVGSNSSEYTALELPNGETVDVMSVGTNISSETVDVMPVGTDISSQYQTLQTLTHLQKLLHSGCALTAAGPAVSTSTPCGSTSVVTPVKVVCNPTGPTSETSPGTSSLIETVNNQGLVIRTQPKLDTVDTSGLGLVSYQDELPVTQESGEEGDSVSEESGGKRRRGRPTTRRQRGGRRGGVAARGRGIHIQANGDGTVDFAKSSSPRIRRVGMPKPRSQMRKNLSIPSTVVIPASVQEQTRGQPILTTIDNKPVWLAPLHVNMSQKQANISMMQALGQSDKLKTGGVMSGIQSHTVRNSSTGIQSNTSSNEISCTPQSTNSSSNIVQSTPQNNTLGSNTSGSIGGNTLKTDRFTAIKNALSGSDTSLLRQTLLETRTPTNAIITPRVAGLSSTSSTVTRENTVVTPKTESMVSTTNDPSPRRQLFGGQKQKQGKGMSQLAAIAGKSSTNTRTPQQRTGLITSNTPSMGSMLFSPKSSKSGAMFSRSTTGVYRIEKQGVENINANITSVTTVPAENGNNIPSVANNFKTPTKPVDLTSDSGSSVLASGNNTPVTAQVSRKLDVDKNGMISMPTDFSSMISQSPLKSAEAKTPQKKVAYPKARRVPLKTLGPAVEGEDSFGANFPNLVSNKDLLSQPGDIIEILSPTSSSQGAYFVQSTQNTLPEESGNVSVENAMQAIEGSIDVETAQTLIKFASHAVITPKKFEAEVDQNSNHCLAGGDLGVVQAREGVTNTGVKGKQKKQPSSAKKKKDSKSSKNSKSKGQSNKKKKKSFEKVENGNLRRSSRLNVNKEKEDEDCIELNDSQRENEASENEEELDHSIMGQDEESNDVCGADGIMAEKTEEPDADRSKEALKTPRSCSKRRKEKAANRRRTKSNSESVKSINISKDDGIALEQSVTDQTERFSEEVNEVCDIESKSDYSEDVTVEMEEENVNPSESFRSRPRSNTKSVIPDSIESHKSGKTSVEHAMIDKTESVSEEINQLCDNARQPNDLHGHSEEIHAEKLEKLINKPGSSSKRKPKKIGKRRRSKSNTVSKRIESVKIPTLGRKELEESVTGQKEIDTLNDDDLDDDHSEELHLEMSVDTIVSDSNDLNNAHSEELHLEVSEDTILIESKGKSAKRRKIKRSIASLKPESAKPVEKSDETEVVLIGGDGTDMAESGVEETKSEGGETVITTGIDGESSDDDHVPPMVNNFEIRSSPRIQNKQSKMSLINSEIVALPDKTIESENRRSPRLKNKYSDVSMMSHTSKSAGEESVVVLKKTVDSEIQAESSGEESVVCTREEPVVRKLWQAGELSDSDVERSPVQSDTIEQDQASVSGGETPDKHQAKDESLQELNCDKLQESEEMDNGSESLLNDEVAVACDSNNVNGVETQDEKNTMSSLLSSEINLQNDFEDGREKRITEENELDQYKKCAVELQADLEKVKGKGQMELDVNSDSEIEGDLENINCEQKSEDFETEPVPLNLDLRLEGDLQKVNNELNPTKSNLEEHVTTEVEPVDFVKVSTQINQNDLELESDLEQDKVRDREIVLENSADCVGGEMAVTGALTENKDNIAMEDDRLMNSPPTQDIDEKREGIQSEESLYNVPQQNEECSEDIPEEDGYPREIGSITVKSESENSFDMYADIDTPVKWFPENSNLSGNVMASTSHEAQDSDSWLAYEESIRESQSKKAHENLLSEKSGNLVQNSQEGDILKSKEVTNHLKTNGNSVLRPKSDSAGEKHIERRLVQGSSRQTPTNQSKLNKNNKGKLSTREKPVTSKETNQKWPSPYSAFPLAKLVEQARKEIGQVQETPEQNSIRSPRKGKLSISPSIFGPKSPLKRHAQKSSAKKDGQSLSINKAGHRLLVEDQRSSAKKEDRRSSTKEGHKSSTKKTGQRSSTKEEGQRSSAKKEDRRSSTKKEGHESSTKENGQRSSTKEEGQRSSAKEEGQRSSTKEEGQRSSIMRKNQRSSTKDYQSLLAKTEKHDQKISSKKVDETSSAVKDRVRLSAMKDSDRSSSKSVAKGSLTKEDGQQSSTKIDGHRSSAMEEVQNSSISKNSSKPLTSSVKKDGQKSSAMKRGFMSPAMFVGLLSPSNPTSSGKQRSQMSPGSSMKGNNQKSPAQQGKHRSPGMQMGQSPRMRGNDRSPRMGIGQHKSPRFEADRNWPQKQNRDSPRMRSDHRSHANQNNRCKNGPGAERRADYDRRSDYDRKSDYHRGSDYGNTSRGDRLMGQKRKLEAGEAEGGSERQHKKHKAYEMNMQGLGSLLSNTSKLEKSLMKIRQISDNIHLDSD